jgi:hypothetical protein
MRTEIIPNDKLKGRAIAGTYVVLLAWDFVKSATTQRKNLLGFAIERTEFNGNCGGGKILDERHQTF